MIFIQVNKLLPVLKVPSNLKVSGNGKNFSYLIFEFTNQDKVTFFSARSSLNFSTVCFPSISYYRESQKIYLLSTWFFLTHIDKKIDKKEKSLLLNFP